MKYLNTKFTHLINPDFNFLQNLHIADNLFLLFFGFIMCGLTLSVFCLHLKQYSLFIYK